VAHKNRIQQTMMIGAHDPAVLPVQEAKVFAQEAGATCLPLNNGCSAQDFSPGTGATSHSLHSGAAVVASTQARTVLVKKLKLLYS